MKMDTESPSKDKKKKKSKLKLENEQFSMIVDDQNDGSLNSSSESRNETPKKKKSKTEKSAIDATRSSVLSNWFINQETPKKKRKHDETSDDDLSTLHESICTHQESRAHFEHEDKEEIYRCLSERDETETMNDTQAIEHRPTIPFKLEQFSCIHHLNKVIKFPLLPIAINQELKIIRLTLIHKWKYRFINELNGFLHYFENLELIEGDCQLLDDLPFVYYKIRADFYVFRPKVGEYLKAKISCFEDSNKFINCSTNVELNIFIQLPDEINDTLNSYLKLHQDIIFLIKHIDYSKMSIEGTINKKCIKLMEENIELKQPEVEQEQNNEESNLDDFFAN